jgi:multiple sugar transport system permease protein
MPNQKRGNGLIKGDWLSGYLFLLPALLFFMAFVLYPIIEAGSLSMYRYDGFVKTFTGIANYQFLFKG